VSTAEIDIEGPYGSEVVIDILRAFKAGRAAFIGRTTEAPRNVPSPSEPFGADDRNERDHDRQNRIFKDHAEPTREDQTTTRGL